MPEFLPFVRRWFAETFSEPTRPQREGWEAIASGRDTLIVAPTGSGKTLAAFLWALDHLHRLGLEWRLEDRVYVVYVSPLRALNNDIEKTLRAPLAGIQAAAAADGTRLPEVRVAVRTGDTLAAARQAMTRRPPHILITTPESLYILLTSERFRPALARTRFVIVDEVHALMGGKRGAHLALSLERLAALVEAQAPGARPQRIGCSATVSPLDATLDFLTGATARDPVVVDIGFARELDLRVVAPVDDFLTATSDTIWDATLQLVAELVQTHRTTLVFAQSRRAAERIARDLNDRIADGRVAAHHGSLSRRARLEAENRLKEGELRALVATSSLELGIDVGAIDLVVQLQSPRNIAAALQRVGRAGHLLSRVSKGRIVVTRGEELGEAAAVVRSIRARELDRTVMPEAPLDVLAQQIVAAVAAESVGVDTLWQRFRNAAPYRTLSREDFVAVVGAGPRRRPPPPRRRRPSRHPGLRRVGGARVWARWSRGVGDAALAREGWGGPRGRPRRSGRDRRVVLRRAGRAPRDDPLRLRHANQRRLGYGAPREAPARVRHGRRGQPRRRWNSPLVRPGPGAPRARAARAAPGAGGGRNAPGARPHWLAPPFDPLFPRGGARPLYSANVPGRAHARVPPAPQGRRAPRSGRGPGRVPPRGGNPARVL